MNIVSSGGHLFSFQEAEHYEWGMSTSVRPPDLSKVPEGCFVQGELSLLRSHQDLAFMCLIVILLFFCFVLLIVFCFVFETGP